MASKKFSNFMNRQTPSKGLGTLSSMKFSNLDIKPDDSMDKEMVTISSTSTDPLSRLSIQDDEEVDSISADKNCIVRATDDSKNLSSSLPTSTGSTILNTGTINFGRSVRSVSPDSQCSSDHSNNPTVEDSGPPSFPTAGRKLSTHTQASHVSKVSNQPASDTSAADIHALLDTFHKDSIKKERRKPSDIVKNRSASSILPVAPSTSSISTSAAVVPPTSVIPSQTSAVSSSCAPSPWQTTPPPMVDITTDDKASVSSDKDSTIDVQHPNTLDLMPSYKTLQENSSPLPTSSTQAPGLTNETRNLRASTMCTSTESLKNDSNKLLLEKSSSANSSPILRRRKDVSKEPSTERPLSDIVSTTVTDSSMEKSHLDSLPVSIESPAVVRRGSKKRRDKTNGIPLEYKICGAIFLGLVFLYIIPVSGFVIGFVFGLLVALGILQLYRYLITPSLEAQKEAQLSLRIPALRDLPPPQIPEIQEDTASAPRQQRGWLNELPSYNPDTFSLNTTYSVYVTLEGTQLRLQRPKTNVPRRAMYNEQLSTPVPSNFIHQRIYDMLHARIVLQPDGLVKKRLWSKKYPICLVLNRDSKVATSSVVKSTSTPNFKSGQHGSSSNRQSTSPVSTNNDHGFEIIEKEDYQRETIYLFARTSRDKEEWFRHFQAATLGVSLPTSLKTLVKNHLSEEPRSSSASTVSMSSFSASAASDESVKSSKFDSASTGSPQSGSSGIGSILSIGPVNHEPLLVTYIRYMAKFMPADWLMQSIQTHSLNINYISCDSQVLWLNALLGRVFWDFFREAFWVSQVREKLQNKLKKLHLPYFIDELTVVDIDLGNELPVIRRTGRPYMDVKGIWLDLDIAYAGGFVMALETKVNLLKVKEQALKASKEPVTGTRRSSLLHDTALRDRSPGAETTHNDPGTAKGGSWSRASSPGESVLPGGAAGESDDGVPGRVLAAFREEEEDSAESSTDSEADDIPLQLDSIDTNTGDKAGGGASRRIIRLVDRLSKSRYFAKALESRLIQRGMEYVSNTKLVLHVEVQLLTGTLALNLPPPPSDRLWYGFRTKPQLKLTARPKVGEKEVTMAKITEWIEKKLNLEFQRVMVMPNMDDIVIPLLCSGSPDNYGHNLY